MSWESRTKDFLNPFWQARVQVHSVRFVLFPLFPATTYFEIFDISLLLFCLHFPLTVFLIAFHFFLLFFLFPCVFRVSRTEGYKTLPPDTKRMLAEYAQAKGYVLQLEGRVWILNALKCWKRSTFLSCLRIVTRNVNCLIKQTHPRTRQLWNTVQMNTWP